MNEATAKKAGPEAVETPEVGRERSTIGFPYLDLDDAIEIAKAVHTVGGSTCQWDQLAAQVGAAANGGGFRMRVQTAKMYGLLTYDRGTITLSSLGARISDPDQEKSARAESFLTIPLYKAVYEQFKGATLPPTSGLETAMATLGVAPKQKEKARQVFQRSATQAGFFAYGNNKLVMPSIKGSAPAPTIQKDDEPEETDEKEKKPKTRHPLIDGLLQELPEPQAEWGTDERKKWLEMASTIFNVIYKDSDDSRGSLKVVVEKVPAKR
jgi:hypothetical protein